MLSIERPPFNLPTDGSSNHRGTLNAKVIDIHNQELESHVDAAVGVFVFNKTSLPKNDCEKFRSMADIEEGLLYKAKIGNYSILRYSRDNETVAVTLTEQTSACGHNMFRTGIQNVEVLLLKEDEEFIHAKHVE